VERFYNPPRVQLFVLNPTTPGELNMFRLQCSYWSQVFTGCSQVAHKNAVDNSRLVLKRFVIFSRSCPSLPLHTAKSGYIARIYHWNTYFWKCKIGLKIHLCWFNSLNGSKSMGSKSMVIYQFCWNYNATRWTWDLMERICSKNLRYLLSTLLHSIIHLKLNSKRADIPTKTIL
jgi:hypothetical protein